MNENRRDTTMYPEKAILRQWPTATAIRAEAEQCPACKRAGMFYSFTLPQYARTRVSADDGTAMIDCGFYCCACGWGNAGSRPVEAASS